MDSQVPYDSVGVYSICCITESRAILYPQLEAITEATP